MKRRALSTLAFACFVAALSQGCQNKLPTASTRVVEKSTSEAERTPSSSTVDIPRPTRAYAEYCYNYPPGGGTGWDPDGDGVPGGPPPCQVASNPSPTPTPESYIQFSRDKVRPLLNYENDYSQANYGLFQNGDGVIRVEAAFVWTNTGLPAQFTKIRFDSERVDNTGGHNHGKGPTGEFSEGGDFNNVIADSRYVGKPKNSITVETDIRGIATVYYRAYGFAGTERITSTIVENGWSTSKDLKIGLPENDQEERQMGLRQLYKFNVGDIAVDANRSHPGALYGTKHTVTQLEAALSTIARLYHKKLAITGISLVNGGPFDTGKDWVFTRFPTQPNPAEGAFSGSLHREGFEVDIATDDDPSVDFKKLYRNEKYRYIFRKFGFELLNKDTPDAPESHMRHWHWYLEDDAYYVPTH